MANDPFRSTDFSLSIPDRISAYFRAVTTSDEYHGFETFPLQQVQFLSYSEQSQQTVYSLAVPTALCNKDSNLHGGAASTLLDNLSSTALFTISKAGFWDNLGVSRSLHVIFHRPIPAGSKIRVVCSVAGAGRRMATVKAEMIMDEGEAAGSLCTSCVHEKVYIRPSL